VRFDQLHEAKPDTLAVGCPFCMTQMKDAMKARSMEEKMRVRDIFGIDHRLHRRSRKQIERQVTVNLNPNATDYLT
jgi:Fe-S oxidoreductase